MSSISPNGTKYTSGVMAASSWCVRLDVVALTLRARAP